MANYSVNYLGKNLKFADDIPARVSHFHKKGKIYERHMLEYIRKMDKRGIYVDVGANIGNHSVFFARFCQPGRVISIEPIVEIYETLKKNISLNGLGSKIVPLNIAASNKIGRVGVQYIKGKVTKTTYKKSRVTVRSRTLDSLLKGEGSVGLIKIDVEGFEELVLRGARNVLKQYHPELFIEAHTKADKQTIEAIISPLGYKPLRVFNASPTYHYSCQESSLLQNIMLKLQQFRGFRRA